MNISSLGITFIQIYNAYNVADPRVIQFQEDVLEEVIALFPSPVIHIGGDELRYNAWKESPMVRNYMKQNKITSPGGLQVFLQITFLISWLLKTVT